MSVKLDLITQSISLMMESVESAKGTRAVGPSGYATSLDVLTCQLKHMQAILALSDAKIDSTELKGPGRPDIPLHLLLLH